MGPGHFTDDFKRDAVAQITERGYPVAEVSKRLGVSQHSLYAWKRKFSKPPASAGVDQAAEIRRLKAELARVTEERDILKTYGPPRLQGCRLVGMIGLHQRIRSQGLALAKMDIRASRVLIKATASGAAFRTRITEPPV